MSGFEFIEAQTFLAATLNGDSQMQGYLPGGWNLDNAPLNTATPYGIFGMQAGIDRKNAEAYQIFTPFIYRVEVIGPDDQYATMINALGRLSALLDLTRNGATTLANVQTWREQQIHRAEIINGALWRYMGGLYRVLVQYK